MASASTPAGGAPGAPWLTLLLPPRSRLDGDAPTLGRMLARGDRTEGGAGDEAQVLRAFDLLPRGLPVAALTRDFDCGDAAHQTWLRADPAHVRADLGAGRLLACGDLGLSADEAEALLQPLRPLFGDDGCPISAGAPSRWYLALPRDVRLPAFPPPSQVLGDDIFAYMPEGDLGRRWRRLMSEAQVLLHNHPLNAERLRAGKPAVNSLWFWGGGALPDHVRSHHARVSSDDLLFAALARKAGIERLDLPSALPAEMPPRSAFDLRRLREAAALEHDWLVPALERVRGSDAVRLDFSDDLVIDYRRAHRWRFWRRGTR